MVEKIVTFREQQRKIVAKRREESKERIAKRQRTTISRRLFSRGKVSEEQAKAIVKGDLIKSSSGRITGVYFNTRDKEAEARSTELAIKQQSEFRQLKSVEQRSRDIMAEGFAFDFGTGKRVPVKSQDQIVDTRRVETSRPIRVGDLVPIEGGVAKIESQKQLDFFKATRGTQRRQAEFFGSKGFKRVGAVANIITQPDRFGTIPFKNVNPRPFEERSFLGKTAEVTATGFLSFPIALGGVVAIGGEKARQTFIASKDSALRPQVLPELGKAGIKTAVETFDPRTPQGLSVLITALAFGGLRGAVKMQNLQANKLILTGTGKSVKVGAQTKPLVTSKGVFKTSQGTTVQTIKFKLGGQSGKQVTVIGKTGKGTSVTSFGKSFAVSKINPKTTTTTVFKVGTANAKPKPFSRRVVEIPKFTKQKTFRVRTPEPPRIQKTGSRLQSEEAQIISDRGTVFKASDIKTSTFKFQQKTTTKGRVLDIRGSGDSIFRADTKALATPTLRTGKTVKFGFDLNKGTTFKQTTSAHLKLVPTQFVRTKAPIIKDLFKFTQLKGGFSVEKQIAFRHIQKSTFYGDTRVKFAFIEEPIPKPPLKLNLRPLGKKGSFKFTDTIGKTTNKVTFNPPKIETPSSQISVNVPVIRGISKLSAPVLFTAPLTGVKSKVDTSLDSRLDTKPDTRLDQSIKSRFDFKIADKSIFDNKIDTKMDTKLDLRIDSKLNQRNIQEQKIDQRIDQRVEQRIDTRTETPRPTFGTFTPRVPRPVVRPPFIFVPPTPFKTFKFGGRDKKIGLSLPKLRSGRSNIKVLAGILSQSREEILTGKRALSVIPTKKSKRKKRLQFGGLANIQSPLFSKPKRVAKLKSKFFGRIL